MPWFFAIPEFLKKHVNTTWDSFWRRRLVLMYNSTGNVPLNVDNLKAIAVQVRVYEMAVQSGYVLQAPQSCGKNVWWYTKFEFGMW